MLRRIKYKVLSNRLYGSTELDPPTRTIFETKENKSDVDCEVSESHKPE